ncbi:MAG: UDP-N-acetylmuramoyl-L-alanine--D-glutamate ligase [Clostridia bacterium]|nr:UDP-N-acetylmuramoyl-L-alanine--D-glutamate ligase [Clostridia bacterium]
MIKEYLNGRRCAILGLGVSNLPLAQYLCKIGQPPLVYDKADARELGEQAIELKKSGAEFFVRSGEFFDIDADVVFRSPGIRPDKISVLREAELTSEMRLFLTLTPARTFAVTGSDGKTTSTTLTGRFLQAECERNGQGRAFVGGNIGTPLLCDCEQMTKDDLCALELSSFQLMDASCSPTAAAITNISPNHLDWHTGMHEYISAKKNIVGEGTRRFVTNAECEQTMEIARELSQKDKLQIVLFSSKKQSYSDIFGDIAPRGGGVAVYVSDGEITVDNGTNKKAVLAVSQINVPGRHNVENFMTAIGLTHGYVSDEVYTLVAKCFYGVEHRLELARKLDGVRYYNSSIDSSPTRTAAALSALDGKSIVLICGGYDKKIPYEPLARAICEHGGVHTVSLTGATGERIFDEIEKYRAKTGIGHNIVLNYCKDFKGAVDYAHGAAKKGDCVVLSPASASFDAFKNFAERGRVFKDIVSQL